MASINGLSGTSSTIGNYANRISGLASGLDTESLIENSVSGLKMQITNLQKNRQKIYFLHIGHEPDVKQLL